MPFFNKAVNAATDPVTFAAVFSEPGVHANLVDPETNYTLIVHLLIHILEEKKLIPLLNVLVQHGVDLSNEVNNMSIPLGTAALNNRIAAYHFLLLHTDKALINRPLQTPVIIAAAGNLEILQDLIEVQGADIDTCDGAGNTALSLANKFMRLEVMDYLISKKANIWLGNHLPLFDAFSRVYNMAYSFNITQTDLNKYKEALDKLVNATSNYFYHLALAYQGPEESLAEEFLAWGEYIELSIAYSVGVPNISVQIRALLEDKVFNPVLDRIRQEKSQRFMTCLLFHRLADETKVTNKNAISPPLLFDRNLIQDVVSHISITPKHLSLPAKWLGYVHDALVKINMGLKVDGILYALEYKTRSFHYDEKYSQGYANPDYWEMSAPYIFKIKDGVLPSMALTYFFKGLTIADCGSVLVACQYAALLKTLGTTKFNILFAVDAVPMTITQSIFDPVNPLAYFFIRSGKKVEVGDMCYFFGLKYFSKKHPQGHAQGWSVLCTGKNAIGENVYYGFGRDQFKVSSMSESALNQAMIYIYNLPPYQDWLRAQVAPVEDELEEQDFPLQVSYTQAMPAIEGYQADSTITPDYNKIANYMLKEVVTGDEFVADYDDFLKEHNYPSFHSRPTSVLIELPLSLNETDEKDSPAGSPRIGIPMMRY